MSELIQKNDNRATIRWKLLTGASAMALSVYAASAGVAHADDADYPMFWLELGGQVEMLKGTSRTFTAPFMLLDPTPAPYLNGSPTENQRAPDFAFGGDARITFQPENSSWIFSAGIRYGRSHGNRHVHNQTFQYFSFYAPSRGKTYFGSKYLAPFQDAKQRNDEHHAILDFQAGRDVGIGLFGSQSTSTLSAGVRFAQLSAKSSLHVTARPVLGSIVVYPTFPGFPTFYQYLMSAHAERSFRGVGPLLSWSGSAALAGNLDRGELTFDVGFDAALLFGKQKAKTDHATKAYHFTYSAYPEVYHTAHATSRSRSVTVPNAGGFVGLSWRSRTAKISLGYRAEVLFGAMDTGIDARKTSNVTFNGPYASISIGLGN